MVAKTFSGALHGIDALPVTVEVSVGQGQHAFIVGLPDVAVKESLFRIDIAIKSIDLHMPRTRIVINLAPADLPKTGTAFELPLALGILAASDQIQNGDRLSDFLIAGEVGLDGSLLPIPGALPLAICARSKNLKGIILPTANVQEAEMVDRVEVYGMRTLQEAVDFFNTGCPERMPRAVRTREIFTNSHNQFEEDFSDVKGQDSMKRVLEIAAAGGHNVVFMGPPGSGKTMLARRMPTILPPLSLHEALETTQIYSVAGKLHKHTGLVSHRPFRAPHHTSSDAAIAGGGSTPQPGEVSLAHNGVLFLDEMAEFKRSSLEVLRQPMEDKKIMISRAKMALQFPADFMLIASMNPCPCGYYLHPETPCTCPPYLIQKYLAKISGPLRDRIDLQLRVLPVSFHDLEQGQRGESSLAIRERVTAARLIQARRNKIEHGFCTNANLKSKQIEQFCTLEPAAKTLLYKSMQSLHLSARAYERILKVCRTIADLAASETIKMEHVAEAVHYRNLDRQVVSSGEPLQKVKKLYDDEMLAYGRRMGM